MARTEESNGSNDAAIQLARQIDTAQVAEIAIMEDLLGRAAGSAARCAPGARATIRLS
ncbi:hypothetical protein GCM10009606_07350 [Nocardioides aquiterrae]|uniref:DUF305 domain-containing protein n=1 Tax=Nocardioides aquiterrae TaxID=203799 RepID=A0ABP4EWL7_9ACTN